MQLLFGGDCRQNLSLPASVFAIVILSHHGKLSDGRRAIEAREASNATGAVAGREDSLKDEKGGGEHQWKSSNAQHLAGNCSDLMR
jgi:hypothetical protein